MDYACILNWMRCWLYSCILLHEIGRGFNEDNAIGELKCYDLRVMVAIIGVF